MTESGGPSIPPETLEQESLAWVNLTLSGAMTAQDADALKAWRAQSAAHDEAFASAVRFQRRVRNAALLARQEDAQTSVHAFPKPSLQKKTSPISRIGRREFLGTGAAIAAVALLAVKPPANLWPSLGELMSDYRTSKGEQREVFLTDGVTAELNTQTTINRRSIDGLPGVELASGEAVFSVRRPSGSPFSVITSDGRTLVQSGKINIRLQDNGTCVTCVEGKAVVQRSTNSIELKSGRQVTYTRSGIDAAVAADPLVATAWRRGLLIFRDAPLQQVVEELNRYRQGRIILMDDALLHRPVYGVFEIARIQEAVGQVQRLTGAHATHIGDLVLLS